MTASLLFAANVALSTKLALNRTTGVFFDCHTCDRCTVKYRSHAPKSRPTLATANVRAAV